MLDRDENVESSYEKLHKMIGLEIVKEQIDSIITAAIAASEGTSSDGLVVRSIRKRR